MGRLFREAASASISLAKIDRDAASLMPPGAFFLTLFFFAAFAAAIPDAV
jgi:hypothetical protein